MTEQHSGWVYSQDQHLFRYSDDDHFAISVGLDGATITPKPNHPPAISTSLTRFIVPLISRVIQGQGLSVNRLPKDKSSYLTDLTVLKPPISPN